MVANLRHHAADRVGVRKRVMLSFPDCRIAGPPLPSAPHSLFFSSATFSVIDHRHDVPVIDPGGGLAEIELMHHDLFQTKEPSE
jgi:hypothetical protein